jgi:hypothetical protein
MRWKALLAVLLILAIAGLLLVTKSGQNYLDFFKNGIGRVGSFVTGFIRFGTGKEFQINLTASKEQFAGLKFKVENSSLTVSGNYLSIKIGDQIVGLKNKKTVDLSMAYFNGNVEFTAEGNAKISAESNSFEIEDMNYFSEKPVKIEMIVEPTKLVLTNLFMDRITFSSLTGELQRVVDDKTDSISLKNDKLEISNFAGMILSSDGKLTLQGFASAVKGEGFSFS